MMISDGQLAQCNVGVGREVLDESPSLDTVTKVLKVC